MKVKFKSKVTRGFSLLAASWLKKNLWDQGRDGYTCQILLDHEVLQMLQKAKTHAISLGNHMTETTENRSALTKTPNFGIFRFILLYSGLFGCHSGSFRYIPVPFLFIWFELILVLFRLIQGYSSLFWFIKFSTSDNAFRTDALIGSLNLGYQLIYLSLTLYGK